MGTNFYVTNYTGDNPIHIGKRSAAGIYCWDCNITLAMGGNDKVHSSKTKFYTSCPSCGKVYKRESISESSAGRELGFNKSVYQRKTGVSSCSSFTWAVDPDWFIEHCKKLSLGISSELPKSIYDKHIKFIRDEYNDLFSYNEFIDLLKECPIQFLYLIGRDFS